MLLYPLEAVALDSEPTAKTKLIAIELIMAVCSTFVWGRGIFRTISLTNVKLGVYYYTDSIDYVLYYENKRTAIENFKCRPILYQLCTSSERDIFRNVSTVNLEFKLWYDAT